MTVVAAWKPMSAKNSIPYETVVAGRRRMAYRIRSGIRPRTSTLTAR
jgi:hypothetical protein